MKDSLKDQIYTKVRNDILLGKLRAGDRLFEKDIAQEMDVSRTPVREALLLLEKDSLLIGESRSGFVVRRITLEEMKQYFEIRESFFDYAAGLVAINATEEDFKLLEDAADRSEKAYAAGDLDGYVLASTDYHNALWEATHTELFIRVMYHLNDVMILFRTATLHIPHSITNSICEHRSIIGAMRSHNKDLIMRTVETHVFNQRSSLQLLSTFF